MSTSLRTVWRQTAATLAFLLAGSVLAAERPATEGAVPGQWTMDFDAACQVAAAKKLPIFINFTGSDWCGWCKLMDSKVFSQAPWQAYAKDRLLLVWIDFPQDKALVPEKFVARNQALAKQFGVEGYPAYILLDDDGKSLLGQLGADREVTPGGFMAQVREVLSNRPVEVEKLLAGMPAAAAQDYRSTAAQLQQARAEQGLACAQGDIAPDHHVDHAVLVLEGDEDDAARGVGPLPADDDAGGAREPAVRRGGDRFGGDQPALREFGAQQRGAEPFDEGQAGNEPGNACGGRW